MEHNVSVCKFSNVKRGWDIFWQLLPGKPGKVSVGNAATEETYRLGSIHVTSLTAAEFTEVDALMARTSKCSLSTV